MLDVLFWVSKANSWRDYEYNYSSEWLQEKADKGIHDVKKRAWMHAAATGAKAPGQVATTCMPDGVKWQKILSHIM